ncbi:hypothetical protein M1D96_05320 [Pseudomonas sp. D1-3]|uniref:hypothetical protein n=1 Tax=Phytopseudomonas argentinensis TaxID=289370 RepID=UPI00147C5E64|nr:hypothetical protein [Pseudomonas argentinensis]
MALQQNKPGMARFFMPGCALALVPILGEAANRRQKNGRLMRPEKSIDAPFVSDSGK